MPASLCVVCRGHHGPHLPCPCFRCGIRHSDDCMSVSDSFFVAPNSSACVMCGNDHSSLSKCPCHRCGMSHEGDCATVCARCQQCHGNKRCLSSGNFTFERRSRARLTNDEEVVISATVVRHDLGLMCVKCPHCQARMWIGEKLNCCRGGSIVIEELNDVPAAFSGVILSSHVRQNIRSYNTVMAFASTGHKNKSFVDGTFVLGGRSFHRIGSLVPHDNSPHCFSQIYVLDTNDATNRRSAVIPGLRANVLSQLHELMLLHNPLAQTFKMAAADCRTRGVSDDSVGLTWSATDELSRFEIGAMIERAG